MIRLFKHTKGFSIGRLGPQEIVFIALAIIIFVLLLYKLSQVGVFALFS